MISFYILQQNINKTIAIAFFMAEVSNIPNNLTFKAIKEGVKGHNRDFKQTTDKSTTDVHSSEGGFESHLYNITPTYNEQSHLLKPRPSTTWLRVPDKLSICPAIFALMVKIEWFNG